MWFSMKEKTEIANIIIELNHSVAVGNLNILDKLFHENIKILSQEMEILGDGKEACIKSYFEFLAGNKIEKYDDHIEQLFLYENTAVVLYSYLIKWSDSRKLYEEQSKELYVLTHENDGWYIILRKLIGNASV